MNANTQVETAVKAVMQNLTDAYAQRDRERLRALFAPDPDVVMYGTGADEKRIGLDAIVSQAERDWAQSEAVAMNFTWVSVSAAGSVAWVAVDGAFEITAGGQNFRLAARGSFVLEQRDSAWLFVHGHLSLPAGGQEEGESFPEP